MSSRDGSSKQTIAIAETSIPHLGRELIGKTIEYAVDLLSGMDLRLLYESKTSVLNHSQRKMYERLLSKAPKELEIFLDPVIISFALKDACDLSTVDYIWLDLEGEEDVGNMVWVDEKREGEILKLMNYFLRSHLEKYIIDAYDRLTREDLVRVWEAEIDLKECPICGKNPLERKRVKRNRKKLRCWVCLSCGHHVIIPSDILDFIGDGGKLLSR